MHGIQHRVNLVRRRQQWQWAWQCASWGLLAGSLVGTVLAALMVVETVGPGGWMAVAASLVLGPLAGCLTAVFWRRPLRGAAAQIDRSGGLKDRVATAWAFLGLARLSPVQQLQVDDAAAHTTQLDPVQVVPLRVPRAFPVGVLLSGLSVALIFLAPTPLPVVAAVADPALVRQAQRLDEQLEELEKFNEEERDPEIEKLLEQLAATLEQLQQPGVEPKEAMARLSEMEAALEAQQQQLASPQMDAQMQQLGEALSLAQPLATAGRALEQGEFEKAAEELERQELPELDRQTEKSLIEKLEKIKQGAADGAQRQFHEALGLTSAGLSGGNRKQYKNGLKGLASQSRGQARRRKLASLLKRQSQSLAAAKDDWGTDASKTQLADKTAMLKTSRTMDIKGQESLEGDVNVETVQSSEQQQQAVREYRQRVEKYTQLSESVLESEPIPLGHRQTIRRYFELIRPQASEVDAVNEATGE